MIGCIKAISPCVKSASAKLFLDLHTVLAPSGEERTLGAAAQVERARWCCRRFDSDTQTRCGSVTVMVLVSSASGPRVRGCPRAPRYFHPNPVLVLSGFCFTIGFRSFVLPATAALVVGPSWTSPFGPLAEHLPGHL